MVPKAGLEPARLAPLPPQDSVSTNSTTWAIITDNATRGISLQRLVAQFQFLTQFQE